MPNTYLNENFTSPYPFFGNAALPFPQACIVGLGVCIHSNEPIYPVYATSISIGLDSVYMVLCYEKDGQTITLGTLFADTNSKDKTGLLTDTATTDVSGFLYLGMITPDAVGQYTGKFYIDPSCVSYMPDSIFGVHKYININDSSQQISQVLSIATTGLLNLTGTTIEGTEESATDALYSFTDENIYEANVKTINGVATLVPGYTGTLRLVGDASITFHADKIPSNLNITNGDLDPAVRAKMEGTTVVVVINGGTTFPSCYPVGDQASDINPWQR